MLRALLIAAALTFAGCRAAPDPAPPDDAELGERVGVDSADPSAWHCYSWIHGDDFGDACFRSPTACTTVADRMRADHREVRACRVQSEALCFTVGETESCFATQRACQQGRMRVSMIPSECAPRS